MPSGGATQPIIKADQLRTQSLQCSGVICEPTGQSADLYPDRLVVAAEGNILCEHTRVIERNHKLPPRTIYDWRHYLAVVQRKPGALRNGAPFLELPPAFRQLQDYMLRKPGGDREPNGDASIA